MCLCGGEEKGGDSTKKATKKNENLENFIFSCAWGLKTKKAVLFQQPYKEK